MKPHPSHSCQWLLIAPSLKIVSAMDKTFEKNVAAIEKLFAPLDQEARHALLIDLGRKLPAFPLHLKTPENLVRGCQSALYLHARLEGNQLFFSATSDALISQGLAALLLLAYSGLSPETILTHPPTFLTSLNLSASLSPSRSNGLSSIHLKMRQEALRSLIPAY
jgi:cysteine desulfuration protein SufE